MKAFIKKYRLELMFGMVLFTYFLYYVPHIDDLISWCVTPYAMSYRFGFISRGLIGTIIRLLIPNLTITHIYLIITLNTIILCILTVYFLSRIIRKCVPESYYAVVYMAFLFLVNPGSIAFLFYYGNYGRLDLFMIIILLLSALAIIYDRCLWTIPLMCVAGIMIHQAFLFMYFPAIFGLMAYYIIVKKDRRYVPYLAVTTVLTGAMFLYMQFFGNSIHGYTYEEVMTIINNTTAIPGDFIEYDMMVRLEYYTSCFDTIETFVIESIPMNLFKLAMILVLMSPMILLVKRFWKDFVGNTGKKMSVMLPLISLIGLIPKFVMTNDYGRDFSALIISEFVMMFVLYAKNDEAMRKSFATLQANFRKNAIFYLFVIIMAGAIGKFEAAKILEITSRIYEMLIAYIY